MREDRRDVPGIEATCRDSTRAAEETNKPCFCAAQRLELFYALRGVSQPPGLPVLISAAQFVFSLSLSLARSLSLLRLFACTFFFSLVFLLFFFHIALMQILNKVGG